MSSKLYHQKVGLRPGSIVYTGEYINEPNTFSLCVYNSDDLTESILDPSNFAVEPMENHVSWYAFKGLSHIQEFSKVTAAFNIPVLMQEDILHTRQRSKFDRLGGTKSLTVLTVPRLDNEDLSWQQICIFYDEKDIVTFSERESPLFNMVLERIRKKSGKIRELKNDYLLYALIDAVVDQYLNVTAFLTNEVDDLEIDLLNTKGKIPRNFVQTLYSRKKDLLNLLKRANQIQQLVENLKYYYDSDEDLDSGYLVDLDDHVSRTRDNLNHLRQILTEIMNQYLAMNSDHMNEIMKTLTIFSAIFIPLGFIAGLYGMNFNGEKSPYNMPELNWQFGYIGILSIMVSFVIGLLLYFKKRNWL